jgi:hypothetical protein
MAPGGDGTGPDGTYENCEPKGDKPLYRRGRGNRRGMPGTGGRGRGYMNRFYETGLPRWKRGGYQKGAGFEIFKGLLGKLEKILEKLDKEKLDKE